MGADSEKVWAAFDSVLDHGPIGWEEHLADICGDEEEIHERAAALLRAHWEQERLGHATQSPIIDAEALARALGLPTPPKPHVHVSDVPAAEAVSNDGERPLPERVERRLSQVYELGPHPERYAVKRLIGEGGMGAVYLVRDHALDRTLAMKVALTREPVAAGGTPDPGDAESLARFLDEAQVTSQLDHPAIVPVHDLGVTQEGGPFFTMRLVEGQDFGEVIKAVHSGDLVDQQDWSLPRALSVIVRVAEAMAYAHSRGFVHCDLKPANIRVGSFGEVYVLDWGISAILPERATGEDALHAPSTTPLQSRAEALAAATRVGRGVGTPEYMPPEQAAGRSTELDRRADVYSLGATLYHLLAGHPPFHDKGPPRSDKAVFDRAPTPLPAGADGPPAELESICDRAMRREVVERYDDMSDFAADVRAFLENRVVHAHERGAWAEAKKWVRRNRALAASIATSISVLVAGLIASTVLSRIAAARASEVLQLSALQKHNDLIAKADQLWPPHPEAIDGIRSWIRDAQSLMDELPRHRSKLAQLRELALPQTDEERLEERAEHQDASRLDALKGRVAAIRRALDRRRNGTDVELPELTAEELLLDAAAANDRAWPLVDPTREVWGDEPRGLSLALRALDLAEQLGDTPLQATIGVTVARGFAALGRDDEAREAVTMALERANLSGRRELKEKLRSATVDIENAMSVDGIAAANSELATLEPEMWRLTSRVEERQNWRFPATEVGTTARWWHDNLSVLISALEELEESETGLLAAEPEAISKKHGWSMLRRLAFAEELQDRMNPAADYGRRWEEAIAAIASSDRYDGLQLTPQFGLVPIGVDPQSELWEFWHIATGDEPIRGDDGELLLTEEMGVVLVLIPEETFLMGAQSDHPADENFDSAAHFNESPVHEVLLSGYFISKYEMTQGQWLRATGREPSYYRRRGLAPSLLHPVERLSWADALEGCNRLGLTLPSEAQWEHACRAGSSTPWHFGPMREDLHAKVNIADKSAARKNATWPAIAEWPDHDDGAPIHAEIGSYPPNTFGLHEVHGNVGEWCADGADPYAYLAEGRTDPLVSPLGFRERVFRGGGFDTGVVQIRSSHRSITTAGFQDPRVGLRPARSIVP